MNPFLLAGERLKTHLYWVSCKVSITLNSLVPPCSPSLHCLEIPTLIYSHIK